MPDKPVEMRFVDAGVSSVDGPTKWFILLTDYK
ncbi:hypothetical protein SAMN05428947_108291 [Mucilaginibacter sp. OK283]|nr:hypothetical protein SAMN05428947_108291 [Mucilaginibacter sp. OK283]